MKKIIIINGSGGVGKDTFIEKCEDHVIISNISSVEIIKHAAIIFGWDGKKDEKSRKFLSDLKKLVTEYNDGCFKHLCESIDTFESIGSSTDRLLFLHIREPEEIKRLVDKYENIITLLITNSNIEDIITNESDRRVYEYNYDYTIDNSGSIQDLADKAFAFINKLRLLDSDE